MKTKQTLLLSLTIALSMGNTALMANGQVNKAPSLTPATENSEVPDSVIFTAPDGITNTYYMDLLTHDPAVGYIGDYHSKVKITFCENGEVYMPNMVYRNSIKGLMKGKLNSTQDTISFNNKLIVGWGVNQQKYYYLRACNANGQLYSGSEFKFAIDKATGRISSVGDSLYLALYFGEDTNEYYGIAGKFNYLPQTAIDNQLDSYDFSYTKAEDEETVMSSKAKGYFEGDNFYVKGMNPKYPEAWMKGTLVDHETIKFLSPQMAYIMKNDDPIVMLAITEQEGNKYIAHEGFELKYDEEQQTMSGLAGGDLLMANVMLNEDQTTEIYQRYNNLYLKLNPLKPATPNRPEFYSFSANDNEFTFILPSQDTDGESLDTDFMTFRLFMDGSPYTFTKALYPDLKSDEELLDIPFSFHDYNYIYKSGFKRYIYFKEIPQETETLGVEVKYEIKGVAHKSQRLVYNIKTNTYSYVDSEIGSGIDTPLADSEITQVNYYDLTGRIAAEHSKGICIKVTSRANGSRKSEKIIR